MKTISFALLLFLVLTFSSCSSGQFGKILKDVSNEGGLGGLSTEDVASGLKEA